MSYTVSNPDRISDLNREQGAPKWSVRIEGYWLTRTHERCPIEPYAAAPVYAWDREGARILAISRTSILDGSRRAIVTRAP